MSQFHWRPSRRRFVQQSALLASGVMTPGVFSIVTAATSRPQMPLGVASGDVAADGAVLWSKTDRPARMIVEYATTEGFENFSRIVGPAALEPSDYTARMVLQDLPAGQDIFYRVQFHDLTDMKTLSEPVSGHFRTAPMGLRDIRFVWSGDTAGQGWGINEEWGGMKIYRTMNDLSPDFFIHSGDTIYADGPLQPEVTLDDGSVWRNLMTEEKAKVAETLKEFRGNYAYNMLDANVLAFNSQVPMIMQWDDHETVNNWYPGEILEDQRYSEKNVSLLAARAKQAFLEYNPVRLYPGDHERIYRAVHYGPLLDVFVIDMRSYRAANTANRQEQVSEATTFLGREQIRWLKQQLLASKATWKVIASDMPVGLVVRDGDSAFENLANGDGPALGRELEIADLLRFIKHNDVQNVVWLTADVHYTAAHYYDPANAQFSDFTPFWEFVSGPLNAGTFGPNELDNTFGPRVVYQKAPEAGQFNLPPSAGMQFFGQVNIDAASQAMRVSLHDLEGVELFAQVLEPVG